MLQLTLRGLQANRVRFALTTFGVVLAVSFVVSALVLGDGLRRSLTEVSEEMTSGVDLQVRPIEPASEIGEAQPLPITLVDEVARVDGVAAAHPAIAAPESAIRPVKPDGEPISIYGPPQLAFNWVDDPEMSQSTLVDGRAPEVGEFVMDLHSAAKHGFVVGGTYDVLTPDGRQSFALSGTFTFGPDNATLGSVLMAMNTAEAGSLFGVDGIDAVEVRLADGADPAEVEAAIAEAFPDTEVLDNAAILAETTESLTDGVDVMGNILLGFGGVALFVSIFIIYNTFAIVIGQRTGELALLRAIGASPTQIRRSVIGEALVVGALASAGGIGGGIALARGIDALVGATGVELPDFPLIVSTRTIVAALVIGFGVTMVAAVGPARKASTVPAIAALRATTETGPVAAPARTFGGVATLGFGLAAGSIGLTGVGSTPVTVAALSIGAMAVFLGVAVLSPLLVDPVTAVVGWPLRRTAGMAGEMAQRNAARNPRRTATTAAALMIGLALVTTALVVGESIKASIRSSVEEQAAADRFVTDSLDTVDFPAALVDDLAASPIVATSAGFALVEARLDGSAEDSTDDPAADRTEGPTVISITDLASIESVLHLDLQESVSTIAAEHPVLVQVDEAEAEGLAVGDPLSTTFTNGATVDATVAGLYAAPASVVAPYVYDTSTAVAAGLDRSVDWIALALVDGADPADVEALAAAVTDEFPAAKVETAAEYTERIEGSIDNLLAIVNSMVALAVIIALIGIANTLALSIFERTRELGLVRAVGMTRRQVRRMIRIEASMIAGFGAVLGVAIGVLFGWGVAAALPESVVTAIAVPGRSILILVATAAVAGVAAAWLPARRAGRLDVLDAIAH